MTAFTVRPVHPEEFEQLGALIVRVFHPPAAHAAAMQRWRKTLERPDFRPEDHRVGVVDGRIVAHVGVERFTLRYGRAQIEIAGMTAVCTAPAYRGRGYAAALMHDALAYAMEQGAHLTLLRSVVKGYYERFGFSPVWPTYSMTFDSAEAAALTPIYELRAGEIGDLPEIAALYAQQWEGRAAFARPPESWLWRWHNLAPFHLQVIADERGQLRGYAYSAHQQLDDVHIEVGVDSLEAAVTLLAHAGRAAQQHGRAQIEWLLPPDDLLLTHARDLLSVSVKAHYARGEGWMGRIIDSSGLVAAVLQEIIAQGQIALPQLNEQTLRMICTPDGVEIGLQDQPATYCQIAPQDFAQLLFGSLRPAALAARAQPEGSHPTAEAIGLLERLFPPRIAAIGFWDWF